MSTPSIDDLENMPEGSAGQTLENYEHHERHRLTRAGLVELRDTVDNATTHRGVALSVADIYIPHSTETIIQLDTAVVEWDDGFYSGSGGHIVVPAEYAGRRVRVDGHIAWNYNETGFRRFRIQKNAVTLRDDHRAPVTGTGGNRASAQDHSVFDVVQENDYFRLVAFQTSGGDLHVLRANLSLSVL